MRLVGSAISIILALLAIGCSPPPEQARYTVDEYRANAELRHAQVERCQRDPGSLKKTPDCINAQTAAAFEDRLRLRDAPAVGLDPKRKRGSRSENEASDTAVPSDERR